MGRELDLALSSRRDPGSTTRTFHYVFHPDVAADAGSVCEMAGRLYGRTLLTAGGDEDGARCGVRHRLRGEKVPRTPTALFLRHSSGGAPRTARGCLLLQGGRGWNNHHLGCVPHHWRVLAVDGWSSAQSVSRDKAGGARQWLTETREGVPLEPST